MFASGEDPTDLFLKTTGKSPPRKDKSRNLTLSKSPKGRTDGTTLHKQL
jgi:hypothetical protein